MNGSGPGSGRPPSGDDDLGAPVVELAVLAAAPAVGFVERFRRRVERRSLGASLASLAWFAPAVVVLELLSLVFEAISPDRGDRDKGESR